MNKEEKLKELKDKMHSVKAAYDAAFVADRKAYNAYVKARSEYKKVLKELKEVKDKMVTAYKDYNAFSCDCHTANAAYIKAKREYEKALKEFEEQSKECQPREYGLDYSHLDFKKTPIIKLIKKELKEQDK